MRLDTSGFGEYLRQGVVENVKVPKPLAFSSFAESKAKPAAATLYGCFAVLIEVKFF